MAANNFREKGMELLEQGANTAKQQGKAVGQTVAGQITGQQPPLQNSQPQKLDGVRAQLLGDPHTQSQPVGLRDQILGGSQISSTGSESQNQSQAAKQANDQFVRDLYGETKTPEQNQQVLSQQNLAAKSQEDQNKLAALRKHQDNYYKPEVEQKIEKIRQEKLQMEKHEEKVEEQQKMEELQVEEKKKDEDIALKRIQNKAEIKIGGGG